MSSSLSAGQKPPVSSWVFDSSAILAYLTGEPGGDDILDETADGMISAVNLVEVITRLQDRGSTEQTIALVLNRLEMEVVPFSEEQAADAGFLRNLTRHLGLSLGDRACLALARDMGLPVLTADRVWAKADVGVEIRLIR